MLAFDFRLIYNPTWLCLRVYLESRQRWLGKAAERCVAWDVCFPQAGVSDASPKSHGLVPPSANSVPQYVQIHRALGSLTAWR